MREGSLAEVSSASAARAAEQRLRLGILHVNTSDRGGGAERNSVALAAGCRAAGHQAWLAVGRKWGNDRHTLPIADEHTTVWTKSMLGLVDVLEPLAATYKPLRRIRRLLDQLSEPFKYVNEVRGRENFHFPQSRKILQLPPNRPDIVHAHNLHGDFFDLRWLATVSRQLPCVLTLRDEWLLTGHCAYSGGCRRWVSGCGACPDISIYPAIKRDATAKNWRAKAAIYGKSRLFLAAPSQWLLAEAERSILAAGMVEGRVIPNGIDTHLFRPDEKTKARRELGLPIDRHVILASANNIRSNRFKDWPTLRAAAEILGCSVTSGKITLIALGEAGAPERIGKIDIRFVPFENDSIRLALHYQAADLFLHAARSENFPTTVLEALSCGTPVIATAVGGIPEQIRDLAKASSSEVATGVLVAAQDAQAMAHWIRVLLDDPNLRLRMGERGRADAEARFTFSHMLRAYLNYYEDAVVAFARLDALAG